MAGQGAIAAEAFWQALCPPGALRADGDAWAAGYHPAALPDGRMVALPLRVLPGDGRGAVASLVINQASFAVQDALADALAAALAPHRADIVVGVPTLGIGLASAVARRLGQDRIVPLGTSRKFWYDAGLSVPVSSITSPDETKRLWLDPRMLPLLAGRRIALVDDVTSTGRTLAAALELMARVGAAPAVAGFAMLQGEGWRRVAGGLPVVAAIRSPRFRRDAGGPWSPEPAATG
jgi:adenine/guanine phosphoribosyltransferase-like PRPP-binding protein